MKTRSKKIKKTVPKKTFDYDLDFTKINFGKSPHVYRVGKGEQGVLSVEPYKSEILEYWRFKNPAEAKKSAAKILKLYGAYKKEKDFVGMDMSRKFLQMGYTRARRYANHRSGRKYDAAGEILKVDPDPIKAESAEIFYKVWKKVEADSIYKAMKADWKRKLG